jgi:penicillin-binding protein 2
LYDRGLLAEYPPGSPFKILTGLIALQEGVVDEQPLSSATVDLVMAEVVSKCHCKSFGPLQLHNGIYKSCNAYFSMHI